MTAGSALMGHPPNNQDDYWIVRGFARLAQIPDNKFSPNKGFPPLAKPPPGYHHETRAPGIIASVSVAMAVITVITGTRLGLRYFNRDLRWGWDDWMIIPGWIGAMAWFSCVIAIAADAGGGSHIWEVTYSEINWLFRLSGIGQVTFFVTVGLVKISIALFNKRLTGLISRSWTIAHNLYLAFAVSFILTAIFSNLFACDPPLSQYGLLSYGRPPKPPVCIQGNNLNIALNVVHIVSDFALLLTPIFVLFKIQMATSKKIRLMFLCSVGSVSCIGSVMRQLITQKAQPDITWGFPGVVSWTTVDLVFGIAAASLPVLNSAVPRRWRSKDSNNPTPKIKSFHSSHARPSELKDWSSSGDKSSQEAIHQPEFNFHSEAILHADDKDGAHVGQPTEWNHTMGAAQQQALPANRERYERESGPAGHAHPSNTRLHEHDLV